MSPMFILDDTQRGRAEGEHPARTRREIQPAVCEHPQHLTVDTDGNISGQIL